MSPIGAKIDFKGDPIFEWAAWFFVIILQFIFTYIFEIEIPEKNFLDTKKFIFEGRFLKTIIFLTNVQQSINWRRNILKEFWISSENR